MEVMRPITCPHCRSRLTSKLSRYGDEHVKWCKRCRCVVAYIGAGHEDESEC